MAQVHSAYLGQCSAHEPHAGPHSSWLAGSRQVASILSHEEFNSQSAVYAHRNGFAHNAASFQILQGPRTLKVMRRLFSESSTAATSAVAHTCPDTLWPPISSPTRAERSKLTLLPSSSEPKLVALSVSTMMSKLSLSSWMSVTCKNETGVGLRSSLGECWVWCRICHGNYCLAGDKYSNK